MAWSTTSMVHGPPLRDPWSTSGRCSVCTGWFQPSAATRPHATDSNSASESRARDQRDQKAPRIIIAHSAQQILTCQILQEGRE